MPPRIRMLFSMLSVVFLFLCAAPVYRVLSQRADIWWTPAAMMVPLADAQDRVAIYVGGDALAEVVEAGRLRLDANRASRVVTAHDIGLRFNNWDRVRVQQLPLLLVCAAGAGVSACLLLLVLTGRLAYRGERSPS